MTIDCRFAHITTKDGFQHQVLIYDEDGEPVDWDEVATKQKVDEHVASSLDRV